MNPSQTYIALSILILAIIALLVFFKNKYKKTEKLTQLAGLAFGFILAGLFFSDKRLIGYSLIGIGVILAIIDIKKKNQNTKDKV